jgi:hypothetical protein
MFCVAKLNIFLVWKGVLFTHQIVVRSGVHHHHLSVMELGHLLTRSGLMYPEASSKVVPWFLLPVGE